MNGLRRRSFLTDTLLLCALATILIWPLFRLKYLGRWESIESTFISDARILSEHLPHTGWQPLWYCGTRFDYVYPPALRYGTALIATAGHMTTARAYHLYTAFFYVFGIAAVYWLVRIGTGSRPAGQLSAAATALLSPCFLFVRAIRIDSPHWTPQRLHVLASYGEGPHITALSVLPAALCASWLALRKGHPGALALAAFFCALDVSNNFYGATALAMFFSFLVWAIWLGEGDNRIWLRAAGIALLAYGLSAFWLTPSYFRITLTDLKWVARPGNPASRLALVVIAGLFCWISYRLAHGRKEREWTVFVSGIAILLTLDVLGMYYFGFRIAGEAERLLPEFDLAFILAAMEVCRNLWPRRTWRIPVAIAVAAAFAFAVPYLGNAWDPFPKSGPVDEQYPYRIATWVHDHIPGERVMPTGEVRFWFDGWNDNPEVNGGSDQGMLNQILPVAYWQIMTGDQGPLAVAWLRALGTDAIIVPGPASLENYKTDYPHPRKFAGAAAAIYDDGHDTVIYRIPRLYTNLGRVVDRTALAAAGPIRDGADVAGLAKYLAVVENPNQPPTKIDWRGFNEADIAASASANQSVLFQETWDPFWRAYENGNPLPLRRDPTMGFMLIDVPEGQHEIRLLFETPLENKAGWVIFALTLATLLYLISRRFGRFTAR